MKNYLYCASTTLNLCPISIAKMCFVHFRYMCVQLQKNMSCHHGATTLMKQHRMFLLQNSKIYAWPKITLNDFKTVMDYSIFLNEEYVFDLDQKAKLYNKLSFFDPVQKVLVSCTNLNCNFYNNLITLHSILLCKKNCIVWLSISRCTKSETCFNNTMTLIF